VVYELLAFFVEKTSMKEELLHYIWRFQQYRACDLRTTQGEPLQIINPGFYNTDAGPDFRESEVRVSSTRWYGHVEIHVASSDWIKHGHTHDSAYQNVVLHVVLEEDEPILRANGTRIPCLELHSRIRPELLHTYRKLYQKPHAIPCAGMLHQVPELTRKLWLDRLQIERLEERAERTLRCLQANTGDWEVTFYQLLARGFGLRVNQDAFQELAGRTPLKLLRRHRQQLFQLEALLFGQAGLLPGAPQEAYPQELRKEYLFLQKKYQLRPMTGQEWKFSRMRPAGFPTVRIAQFAMLLHHTDHLFSRVMVIERVEEVYHLLAVKVSNYWATHYRFGTLARFGEKRLGKQAIQQIIINIIVPFLFAYSKVRASDKHRQQAGQLLEQVPAESNRILRAWKKLGVDAEHAGDSQALLQLRKEYCDAHRCLECGIGTWLLRQEKKESSMK